jgi:hypothetical protein
MVVNIYIWLTEALRYSKNLDSIVILENNGIFKRDLNNLKPVRIP